ncbi:PilZ domain-containing protein, partial [Arthrospira platensis SPKY2]
IEEQAVRQAEEPSPLAAQMERLEAKFDLVLALLTEALLPESAAPGPVAMRLSSLGLVFDAGEPIAAGTPIELSIHFSASLPRPVVLYGVVVEPPTGEEGRVAVEFRRLGPG